MEQLGQREAVCIVTFQGEADLSTSTRGLLDASSIHPDGSSAGGGHRTLAECHVFLDAIRIKRVDRVTLD